MTDTNQASEDELRREIARNLWMVFADADWERTPRQYQFNGSLDVSEATEELLALIRTEKLKLLAEVREEAFSGGLSFELDDGQIVIEVETDLKSITDKLEAEL